MYYLYKNVRTTAVVYICISFPFRHKDIQRRLILKPFLLANLVPWEQDILYIMSSHRAINMNSFFSVLQGSAWPSLQGSAGSADFHCTLALKWHKDLAKKFTWVCNQKGKRWCSDYCKMCQSVAPESCEWPVFCSAKYTVGSHWAKRLSVGL